MIDYTTPPVAAFREELWKFWKGEENNIGQAGHDLLAFIDAMNKPTDEPRGNGEYGEVFGEPAALAVPEEVRRNAERYAFLRGDVRPGSVRWARWEVKHWTGWWNPVQGEEMDAAIDAAMLAAAREGE